MTQGSIDMLDRLAVTASYRDGAADRHSSRVGAVSARLAQAVGMAPDDVLVLRRAAAWHDVGKVGIPAALLLKPGPLTADEMRIMRTHATIGARILSGGATPVIKMAESIALSHHERWDGTGYPNRLSGDAIPLSGRIVAVADAFDALTNDRPYRRKRSMGEALAEIIRHRDSQFDGRVVDALATALERPKDFRAGPPLTRNVSASASGRAGTFERPRRDHAKDSSVDTGVAAADRTRICTDGRTARAPGTTTVIGRHVNEAALLRLRAGALPACV